MDKTCDNCEHDGGTIECIQCLGPSLSKWKPHKELEQLPRGVFYVEEKTTFRFDPFPGSEVTLPKGGYTANFLAGILRIWKTD